MHTMEVVGGRKMFHYSIILYKNIKLKLRLFSGKLLTKPYLHTLFRFSFGFLKRLL